MDIFLKTLKEKEKELQTELEQNPLFKQLELVRATILGFQNGHSENGVQSKSELDIPSNYSIEDMTWREKVLFALKKLGQAFISDIVEFVKKQGEKESDEWLDKRIGVTISRLKKVEGVVGVKLYGKKGKYFIR